MSSLVVSNNAKQRIVTNAVTITAIDKTQNSAIKVTNLKDDFGHNVIYTNEKTLYNKPPIMAVVTNNEEVLTRTVKIVDTAIDKTMSNIPPNNCGETVAIALYVFINATTMPY